jgi:hypothetical protein
MAREGFGAQCPLPTVSHYRGHQVSRLLILPYGKRARLPVSP